MVLVQTTRFGALEDVEVVEEAIITFPEGIPGFEQYTEYALIEEARFWPYAWLQPTDEPGVGFVLMDPHLFIPGYAPDLGCQDLTTLGLADDGALEMRCILVVPSDPKGATANAKAPLLINRPARRGKQVILMDERYALRHPVFEPAPDETLAVTASCSS